jgi:hypothetical protein
MPNRSAMKVAWAIASSLATHLALPVRIIFTASIPCNVRQAVKNEPYPFASHVRFFTVRWSGSTTLFRYLIQVLALTETNPTRKHSFFLQRLHGSRIGRVLVHVDHSGQAIAGRAQGLAEETFGPGRVLWP